MKWYSLFLVIVLGLGLCTCISPFTADVPEEVEGIVISASLTTLPGLQEVRILRASPFTNKAYNRPISKAQVWVVDNEGQRQEFAEIVNNLGWYQPVDRDYVGEVGKTYVLHILTTENRKYESLPETVRDVPPIKKLYTEEVITDDPLLGPALTSFSVLLDVEDPASKGDYYRWSWLHFEPLSFCSAYDGVPFGGRTRTLVGLTCCELPCWDIVRCYINCTNVMSDALINGKNLTRHPIVNIPYCPKDYYIEIQQRSISQSAFDYWRTVDQLSASNGSLFDNAPAAIRGNLKCVTDPEEPVYGFFEVSDVHENGFFINRTQSTTKPAVPSCDPIPQNANPFACEPCRESLFRTKIKPKYWTK